MSEQNSGHELNRVKDAARSLQRAQNDYVLALYEARNAGATIRQIADAAGRAPSTISKRLA